MSIPGVNLQLILSTLAAQRQLQQDMTSAARRAGQQSSDAFNAAFRPRNIAQDILPFAATAVVSRGFQTIVKSAQQYEAALNATTQVYGEMSGELNKFVELNSRSLGLAKKDAQDYVNQFGAILIGLDLGQDQAAKFSQQLVKAGAALAAFRNTSVEQAIVALQAGFRGEYDSLQRFIPQVSDLTLTLHAMKMGLADTRSAVDQQDKALALLDITQNSVARSAGQAELEQGNLQTRLAETKAQSIDAATAVGQRLIPALEGSLDVVNAVGPATVLLAAGMLLLGRRMTASAASSGGFIGSMRASASSSFALTTALARQQAQFSGLTVAQALAARQAIVANNAIIASSSATQAALTGLGATWGRLAGQMAAAATTGTIAARSLGVAAVAARGVGMGLAAGMAALGGPVTLALTAATIGVGYFLTQQSKQREESKRAAAENKTYAESLEEIGDRSSQAAKALAAKTVVDNGLAAQADRNYVSLERLTQAYLGNKGALDLINETVDSRIEALKREEEASARTNNYARTEAIRRQIADAEKFKAAVNGNAEALDAAANKQDLYNRALGQSSNQMAGIRDVWAEAKEALDNYREAEELLVNNRVDLIDSQQAVAESLRELTEGIKENGTTLDINTAKGSANIDNIQRYVEELYDQAEAEVATTGVVSAETQKRIDSLKAQLIQMGFNKQQIEEIIAAYKRVPPEVVTQIKVMGGADAQNELTAIGKKAVEMIAQYNLTPTQAFGLASGRDPRAVFGQNRAYGGPIFGPDKGDRADNALVAATPGEWVIQKPSVKKLEQNYGPKAMYLINEGILPIDGQFAAGGPVQHTARPKDWRSWAELVAKAKKLHEDKKKSLEPVAGDPGGGPGGGSLGGSAGMMRIIRSAFPGHPLWSGYRPGSTTLSGKRSFHALDRATDTPPDRGVAAFIHGNYGAGTRELITPFPEFNLHNGRPHRYTGAVWNQHNFAGGNAHNHWAYDQGGPLNPGQMAMNYGSQPEEILNPENTVRFRALAEGQTAIHLSDMTVGKIVQALQTRPVIIQVDGREIARSVFDRGVL